MYQATAYVNKSKVSKFQGSKLSSLVSWITQALKDHKGVSIEVRNEKTGEVYTVDKIADIKQIR
jgi:hypothetical protein